MPGQEEKMDDKLSVLRSSTVRCLSQKKLNGIGEELVLQHKDSDSDDASDIFVQEHLSTTLQYFYNISDMPAQEENMDDKLSVLRSSTVRCLSQKKLYGIGEELVLQHKDSYSGMHFTAQKGARGGNNAKDDFIVHVNNLMKNEVHVFSTEFA
jgi:hypothetical protein